MIPFYVYYSMFGFQRIGDLAWAAGDSRARGFLMGGTAGRTTLNGEGLQHEDGHSHLISATIPNCVSYDPTYAHEVAVIIQDGLRRMFAEQEDVFYYLTIMNENYEHPGLPEERRDEVIEGIKRGMYLLHSTGEAGRDGPARAAAGQRHHPARGRGGRRTARDRARRGRGHLELPELHRAGARHRGRRPVEPAAPRRARRAPPGSRSSSPSARPGPVVAATDYMRAFAEQIRPSVPADRRYVVLGTDGFGRSDYRKALRRHFEVDRQHVVVATLAALAADGAVPASAVTDAIARYDIDPDKLDPARA